MNPSVKAGKKHDVKNQFNCSSHCNRNETEKKHFVHVRLSKLQKGGKKLTVRSNT